MRYAGCFFLCLVFACQDGTNILETSLSSMTDRGKNRDDSEIIGTEQEQDSKMQPNSSANKDQEDEKPRRANFDKDNWIDFDVKMTEASIKAYVYEFKRSATFGLSIRESRSIDNREDLMTFCYSKSYEKKQEFDDISAKISLFINPLNKFISPRIANWFLREVVTSVNNPFKIAKKHVMIEADFLDQSEKNLIIENGAFEAFDELDFLRVNLFHPWAGPGEITSSVIARLFCGIADGKASVLYVFNNDKGETLRVRINSVNFKLLNY